MIPAYLRNVLIIMFLLGWSATVVFYLVHNQLPPTPLLGLPPFLVVSMSATSSAKNAIKKAAQKVVDSIDEEEGK